jgi:biotin transport system substrate-specific component
MNASRRVPTFMDASLAAAGADGLATPIRLAATLFVTVLTAAASQVSVPLPFTPVPFTFQPMIVLLGGAVLGARLGMTAQVLYLAPELPQGAARLLGPTGGYLMAYPFAAFIAGALAGRGLDRRYLSSLLAMAAGLAVIFAFGVTWLTLFAPGADLRSLQQALAAGLYPFVLADAIKLCLAAAVMPAAWKLLR